MFGMEAGSCYVAQAGLEFAMQPMGVLKHTM
jgi:hypothetical protein